MKILLADNHDSFVYNIVQILREEGNAEVDTVQTDRITKDMLAHYDGIVFSPGPDIVDPGGMMTAILDFIPEQMPVLGICLGYDVIATYFGARLNNLNTNYHGLQRKIHIIDTMDPLYAGFPVSFDAGLYHSWQVVRATLPDNLVATAISSDRILMSVRHRERPVFGVQYHPESIMTPQGKRLLINFLRVAEKHKSKKH